MYRMILWLIIACEIGFWVFVLAGLVARYIFNKKRLGSFLLICTPIVDLVLIIATIFDLRNGATATIMHGLAAIYIGISLAFGHQMIKWADGHFNYRFANGAKPEKVKYGKARAKKEREGWYRHVLSWVIGGGVLLAMIYYVNNPSQTEALLRILQIWSAVLFIDFIISFSYTLFPKNQNQ